MIQKKNNNNSTWKVGKSHQYIKECYQNIFSTGFHFLQCNPSICLCFAMLSSISLVLEMKDINPLKDGCVFLHFSIYTYLLNISTKWFNNNLWGPFQSIMNPNITLFLLKSSDLTLNFLPILQTNSCRSFEITSHSQNK